MPDRRGSEPKQFAAFGDAVDLARDFVRAYESQVVPLDAVTEWARQLRSELDRVFKEARRV